MKTTLLFLALVVGVSKSAPQSDDNIFLQASISKNPIYEGEVASVRYWLYTRIPIKEYHVVQMPDFRGFWKREISLGPNVIPTQTTLKGIIYNKYLLKEFQVNALYPGRLQLGAALIECVLNLASVQRDDDLFPDEDGLGQVVNIRAAEISVVVLELPQLNRPDDFSGSVGSFALSAALVDSIICGEQNLMEIVISGEGLVPETFEIPSPFDPESIEVTRLTSRPGGATTLGERRRFTYHFMSSKPGQFTTRPVTLSYFNPNTKSYARANLPGIHFYAVSEDYKKPLGGIYPQLPSTASHAVDQPTEGFLFTVSVTAVLLTVMVVFGISLFRRIRQRNNINRLLNSNAEGEVLLSEINSAIRMSVRSELNLEDKEGLNLTDELSKAELDPSIKKELLLLLHETDQRFSREGVDLNQTEIKRRAQRILKQLLKTGRRFW